MDYIIQAFKALEDIDDEVVVIKPKQRKQLKENLNESTDDYYVLSDGRNPKNSQVYANIENLDNFIAELDKSKSAEYHELLHYVSGNPTKIWDSKSGKVEEACKEEFTQEDMKVELHPEFDSRQSFYGKAKVIIKDEGTQVLYSYGTPVCRIKDGNATLLRKGYLGWFSSPTTLRHVKEFLKQNGFEAGSINDLRKKYSTEDASISEDYNDLEDSWDSIVRDTIKEVKDKTGKDITEKDIHFDDSRAWSFYVPGSKLELPVNKFGAYRNYMGGGVRGPVAHNGTEQDNTKELGEFFAQQLKRIEDLINAGFENEEGWDKPTGVLTKDKKVEEQLNENHKINLNDPEDVDKALDEIHDETPVDEAERIIDVNAETVDKLKDSYVGDVVLICKKCRTPIFKTPEEVKKDEETGFYNIEDECTHCGATQGFELGGQIGTFDKVPEEEQEDAEEETKEKEEVEIEVKDKKVTPIEDENDLTKVESFDDDKFNSLVTKYLKEVYENVESFETTDGFFDSEKIIIEGIIKYIDDKTKDVKFIFENISKTKGNKLKIVGINESLTKDKDAFSVIATVKENALVCETFTYNYKINLNEEETLIRGRTSLIESKRKENKIKEENGK